MAMDASDTYPIVVGDDCTLSGNEWYEDEDDWYYDKDDRKSRKEWIRRDILWRMLTDERLHLCTGDDYCQEEEHFNLLAFSESLPSPSSAIEKLSLEYGLEFHGINSFRVNHLTIHSLRVTAAEALSKALLEDTTLTSLEFINCDMDGAVVNRIHDGSLAALSPGLAANTTLTIIQFYGYLSESNARALTHALLSNESLEEICLCNNAAIGDEAALAFAGQAVMR
jgi:hypothetical protein